MFVKFDPPIDKFVVRRTSSLRAFKKTKIRTQTGCAEWHLSGFYFLFPFGYKSYGHSQ